MCQRSANPHLICLHVLLTTEQFCSDCRAIESEERERKNKILRKWTRIFQESFVKEETTDKVYEAQQFIKDYEKWLEEHPKKIPPKAMKDRYEEDRQFVLSQYRVF